MLEIFKNTDWVLLMDGMVDLGLKMIIAAVMALFLRLGYSVFARDFDTIRPYAKVIIPIAMVMTLLSSIISMNLAVAIGYVGSLAVIRFRMRTENTEVVIFILFGIGVGIAAGMGLSWIVVLGTLCIMIIMSIYQWLNPEIREVIFQVKCIKGEGDRLLGMMKEEVGGLNLESLASNSMTDRFQVKIQVPDNNYITKVYAKLHAMEPTVEITIVPEEARTRI